MSAYWGIILFLLHLVSIPCLRISDAFVDDIEKLQPATSNRIESFVFPTKPRVHGSLFRVSDVSDKSNSKVSFEPLYFKFKHKLENEVKPTTDMSLGQSEQRYTVYGPVSAPNNFPNYNSHSAPVIDHRLLPSYPSPSSPGPRMQYSPSSDHYSSPVSYPPHYDDDDTEGGVDSDYEDNVVVIHEHHHHHHHNNETEEKAAQHDYEMKVATPDSSQLINNILNDKVLFDFVSFLLDEAQAKQIPQEHLKPHKFTKVPVVQEQQPINLPRMDWADQIVEVRELEDDVEQFLADGFEPIIEIELE